MIAIPNMEKPKGWVKESNADQRTQDVESVVEWAYKFKMICYGAWTPKPKGYDFDKLEKARIDQYGYIPSEAEE